MEAVEKSSGRKRGEKLTLVGKGVVGKTVMTLLSSVKPNPWNPNVMTTFEAASLKHGLEHDGWLASQALLIWGKDEKGKQRNLIIDGEHRYDAALALHFEKGPMVFLDGPTEAQAKALTVKMNAKRGTFDPEDLGELLRGIQFDLGAEDFGLDLGIETERLMKLLSEPAVEDNVDVDEKSRAGTDVFDLPGGKSSQVKMVQLFFTPEQHEEFHSRVKSLAPKYKTDNVTNTVMEHLRRAAPPAKK